MRRAAVLYNPVAGAGRAQALAERAAQLLEEDGYAVECLATPGPGGAEPLARERAAALDLLVVAGGDGSIREALAGLGPESRRVPVAVLPCGNANVVARELQIPLKPDAALALLRTGMPRAIDLAYQNGELFLAMVGIGWDARTVHLLARLRRTRLGGLWYRLWADSAYFAAGLLALFSRSPRLRLTVDGVPATRAYRAACIANFRCYGKGWAMVPDAGCASGRLHSQARKLGGFLFVAWQLAAALLRRRTPRFVSDHVAGGEIVVESDRSFLVQVDGDEREEIARLEIRVAPRAARLVGPPHIDKSSSPGIGPLPSSSQEAESVSPPGVSASSAASDGPPRRSGCPPGDVGRASARTL